MSLSPHARYQRTMKRMTIVSFIAGVFWGLFWMVAVQDPTWTPHTISVLLSLEAFQDVIMVLTIASYGFSLYYFHQYLGGFSARLGVNHEQ